MSIIPIFTISKPESAAEIFQEIIRAIQEEARSLSIGIRSSEYILERIDPNLHRQMSPFISSGRVCLYYDGLDSSFHGLMNIDALRTYAHKTRSAHKARYPQLSYVSMPQWHDVYRNEAHRLYKEVLTLIGTEDTMFIRILHSEGQDCLIPCVQAQGASARQYWKSIENGMHKRRSQLKRLQSAQILQAGQDWDTIVQIDGDTQTHTALEALSMVDSRKDQLSSRISLHRTLEISAQNADPEYILTKHFPYDFPKLRLSHFAPNFISQLCAGAHQPLQNALNSKHSLAQEARQEDTGVILSPILPLPDTPHRIVEIPKERKLTSVMLGSSEFSDKHFIVRFERGNVQSIQNEVHSLNFQTGVQSELAIQHADKIRKCEYSVENSFAVEGESIHGLRHVLSAAQPGLKIAGRIVNDFLLINGTQELYIDSYIQHPWLENKHEYTRYIPQMFEIQTLNIQAKSAGKEKTDRVCLRSQSADSSERSIFLDSTRIPNEEQIFLPGSAWIFETPQGSVGIDLVQSHALWSTDKTQATRADTKLQLPASVLVRKVSRHRYSLHFLPIAAYTYPQHDVINGTMEHYSLRLKLGVSQFAELSPISKDNLKHFDSAFVVYF